MFSNLLNQSAHIRKRLVTRASELWHTFAWVMAHLWMSHGTHLNESWHIFAWVMAHLWMSHGTPMNESWHTYEWVMAHLWMSHGTPMNESWHTYKWVMAHLWMSHGTPMNESWHTYEWVMARPQMSHATHLWMSHGTHMELAGTLCSRNTKDIHQFTSTNHVTHTNESWVMSHTWIHKYTMSMWYQKYWLIFVNKSCHAHEWVMSHVTHMNTQVHYVDVIPKILTNFCQQIMSRTRVSHESCHTHEYTSTLCRCDAKNIHQVPRWKFPKVCIEFNSQIQFMSYLTFEKILKESLYSNVI